MNRAAYPCYFSRLAGIVLLNTLAVCAPAQIPFTPPLPAPTALPVAVPSSDVGQEPGAAPLTSPVPALPAAQSAPPAINLAPGDVHGTTLVVSSSQPSQRLAERTRRILALRRLLQLGFNTAEFARSLRLLERLRDISSAPPSDPEKAMEDEYRALLTASPADPLPPSSAVKIMDAARFYREEQAKVWAEMTREIGAEQTAGLRVMLGQGDRYPANETPIYLGGDHYIPQPLRRGSDASSGSVPVPGGSGVPSGKSERSKKRPHPDSVDNTVEEAAPQPTASNPNKPATRAASDEVAAKTTQADSPRVIVSPAQGRSAPGMAPDNRTSNLSQQATRIITDPSQTRRSLYTSQPYYSVVFSPTTVRLTLDEMIDLMREKLNAMNGKSGMKR